MSLVGFPLLLIPLAIYNIFVFLMPGVAFTSPIVSVTLLSRAQWTLTFGDALLALSMILLWFEIVKASRPGARYLTDHTLSLIVFCGAVAEFLLFGAFGTSTFFLLAVLTGVEFLAGVSIGMRHRQYRKDRALVQHEPTVIAEPEPVPPVAEPAASKPPEMATMSPAHESSVPVERKVSDWNASDLIRDESEKTGLPPKA